MKALKSSTYALLVALWLLQVLIRTQHITELAVFIDEGNHIQRATWVRGMEMHPAQQGQGKFLLYLLLSVVDLAERDTALHLARTVVALISLLTSAVIFVIVKKWADEFWALLGVAVYALLPYAFFYERMALADPLAGLLGALTLWQSLRLAAKPTWRRAAWVGIAAAFTVMAKLTMSLAVGFPVLALGLLLYPSPLTPLSPGERGIPFIKKYLPLLVLSGAIFTLLWLPILIPAWLSLQNDDPKDDYVIANSEWVEGEDSTPLPTKIEETWTKFSTMASLPFALVSVGILLVGVWHRPRQMGLLLGCLLLAWLPSVILVRNLQTRYLMSGIPLVVMMLGVGAGQLAPQKNAKMLLSLGIVVWAVLFTLPFAYTLMTDPPALHIPPLDDRNYLWDKYNGYGNREALVYLQTQGERQNDRVYVIPMTKMCRDIDLAPQPNVITLCIEDYNLDILADVTSWQPALDLLQAGESVYILTSLQTDVPPSNTGMTWEQVAVFEKPRGYQQVTVWQVALAP